MTTTITKIGNSYYLRIPAAMMKYFRLTEYEPNIVIEELSRKEAKIRFEKL